MQSASDQISNNIVYEVRLSTSLENVVVDPSDLKRNIKVNLRIHSVKGAECQIINISVRIDSTVLQLL